MPKIGDIVKGIEVGYKNERNRFMWLACPDCGKERWIGLRNGKPIYVKCNDCANKGKIMKGRNNPNWQGGRKKDNKGYVLIWIKSTNLYYSMCNSRNYILEHRLVMAKQLGRCLEFWEIVHHINGVKDDNRIENLGLFSSNDSHLCFTRLENKIKKLKEEKHKLRKELYLCKKRQ